MEPAEISDVHGCLENGDLLYQQQKKHWVAWDESMFSESRPDEATAWANYWCAQELATQVGVGRDLA